MFALVDGNAFYASCEQVFRPALRGKPIVVLSNNDGCIVAANKEAKELGDIMYQPFFQLEAMLNQKGVTVFSSNYELYGDLSHRMHTLLASFAVEQEIYSIDECFLDFRGMRYFDFQSYGQAIKRSVMKQLGLPVAVGIGASKTLAKAANNRAKKIEGFNGVLAFCDLSSIEQDRLLAGMPVADIWGVGRKWCQRLNALGIESALDLKRAPTKKIRKHFNVVLERTVLELNGVPCMDLELIAPDKQQIISSRAFSQMITDYDSMQQAVARYVARAAEKLRQQNGVCRQVSVGITTNAFKQNAPQYHNLASVTLVHPSNHTGHLIERAKRCLQRIWRDGYEYKKAYVMLSDIREHGICQYDLFAARARYSNSPKSDALMAVLDRINARMGRGTCRMATEGVDGKITWPMKRYKHSPRYTTQWGELPVVYINKGQPLPSP